MQSFIDLNRRRESFAAGISRALFRR